MSAFYCLYGTTSRDYLTYKTQVIYHDNPRELLWLFKKSVDIGAIEIRQLAASGVGRPLIKLRDHPDMQGVVFPLEPSEFRE